MEAAQTVEAGCLADAVRTDQPDDLAGLDGEVAVGHRRQSADALREAERLKKQPSVNASSWCRAMSTPSDCAKLSAMPMLFQISPRRLDSSFHSTARIASIRQRTR